MGLEVLAIGAIGASIIGGGMQLAGAIGSNNAQKDIIAGEKELEKSRKEAMELKARRESIQVLRDMQIKQSISTTRANAQGALEGSGVAGGLAGIAAGAGFNLSGIYGNLGIGRDMFETNVGISNARENLADWQTLSQTGQGLASMGNSIMNAAPAYSRLSQGLNATGSYKPYNISRGGWA